MDVRRRSQNSQKRTEAINIDIDKDKKLNNLKQSEIIVGSLTGINTLFISYGVYLYSVFSDKFADIIKNSKITVENLNLLNMNFKIWTAFIINKQIDVSEQLMILNKQIKEQNERILKLEEIIFNNSQHN